MARPKKTESVMWITPAAIEANAIANFGPNWRQTLPKAFDISYSQLHRYMTVYNGQTAPKAFAMALVALALMPKELREEFDAIMAQNAAAEDRSAVKFIATKADKPAKPQKEDAPAASFDFGGDDEEPAAPEPAPPVVAAVEEAKATIAKASKPKAKKPSLDKASAMLGKALTPPAETKAQRDARKKREKRAAEKAAKAKAEAA